MYQCVWKMEWYNTSQQDIIPCRCARANNLIRLIVLTSRSPAVTCIINKTERTENHVLDSIISSCKYTKQQIQYKYTFCVYNK